MVQRLTKGGGRFWESEELHHVIIGGKRFFTLWIMTEGYEEVDGGGGGGAHVSCFVLFNVYTHYGNIRQILIH